jgi:adenine-specific DNA-methyltransferase
LLPNELFSNTEKTKEGDTGTGILDVFDRYNFTVKEDEPLDKEVAVDPEMLGKVFENLLEVKDRKSKGTYYTPREIVHYICQESLINYLDTALNTSEVALVKEKPVNLNLSGAPAMQQQVLKTEGHTNRVPREDIESLVRMGDIAIEHDKTAVRKQDEIEQGKIKTTLYGIKLRTIAENAKLLDVALSTIRVCDPAIGSGAFPVGMMSEIVRARNTLTTYLPIDTTRTNYHFKRHAIQHCLYGVDIDPGAVEIAKLRLWLSLVVDEDDIEQIQPLPNLDYKIVCGNSLLGVSSVKGDMFSNNLGQLKEAYFNETSAKKKLDLREQIEHQIKSLTNSENIFDFEIYFSEVFHEKRGFDVLIANPPYIGQKGNNILFTPIKNANLGKFHQRRMDYYYFFFHLALNIGIENSIVSFITTNYYLTATYADKLRTDIKQRAIVKNMLNFNELKIFESALGQHNMITILEKGQDENTNAHNLITTRQGVATPQTLHKILGGDDVETCYYKVKQKDLYDGDEYYMRLEGNSKSSNDLSQIIIEKIKKQSVLLGNACNVVAGIQTGANKISQEHLEKYGIKAKVGDGIFVLSKYEISELNLSASAGEILKPWFKNSDIFKWFTNTNSDEKLIYYTNKNDNNLDHILKEHFEKYKAILINRNIRSGTNKITVEDYHDFVNNKKHISYVMIASSFKEGKYYCISYARDFNIFNGPKIIAPQRSTSNTFGYNDIPWFVASDVFFITEKDCSISLKYLLALLNSHLYYYWLYNRGKRKGETLELIKTPLSEIPIKKIDSLKQQPFIDIVDSILTITKEIDNASNSAKRVKVKELESQIDRLVYQLYELTPEEIAVVEGKSK